VVRISARAWLSALDKIRHTKANRSRATPRERSTRKAFDGLDQPAGRAKGVEQDPS
jgi:hypothetical protein